MVKYLDTLHHACRVHQKDMGLFGTTLKGEKCDKKKLSTKNLQKSTFSSVHRWPASDTYGVFEIVLTGHHWHSNYKKATQHIGECPYSALGGSEGAWWCQELMGCSGKNTSKIKFCSCPCTDTTWPPRTTKQPHILLMHSASMLQRV